jgi:hypothetical protein
LPPAVEITNDGSCGACENNCTAERKIVTKRKVAATIKSSAPFEWYSIAHNFNWELASLESYEAAMFLGSSPPYSRGWHKLPQSYAFTMRYAWKRVMPMGTAWIDRNFTIGYLGGGDAKHMFPLVKRFTS